MLVILAVTIAVIALFVFAAWRGAHPAASTFWCRMGLHSPDYPGGHCARCGWCDETFCDHVDCRLKKNE